LEVAQCCLCGVSRPLGLLVPDGGQACADIRWYCKDAKSCTERWTAARPPRRAHLPADPGPAVAGDAELEPDDGPDERLDGLLEKGTVSWVTPDAPLVAEVPPLVAEVP
jgi:hypothetical protein